MLQTISKKEKASKYYIMFIILEIRIAKSVFCRFLWVVLMGGAYQKPYRYLQTVALTESDNIMMQPGSCKNVTAVLLNRVYRIVRSRLMKKAPELYLVAASSTIP